MIVNIISIVGLILIIYSIRIILKSKLSLWVLYPLIAIIIQVTRNLIISPLMSLFAGDFKSSSQDVKIVNIDQSDAWIGMGLILITYICIAMGMWVSTHLFKQSSRHRVNPHEKALLVYSKGSISRAWRMSFIVFVIGILAHGYVFKSLLSTLSLAQIAAERAAFSSALTVESAAFLYAKVISSFALIGSISLASFSRGQAQFKISLFAFFCTLISIMAYGGRATVLYALTAYLLNYHLTVRPLKIKSVFAAGIVAAVFFIGVSYLRFSGKNLSIFEIFKYGLYATGASRIDQATWISSLFPDYIPYLGVMVPIAVLARLMPGLEVVEVKDLWGTIVDYFYSGKSYMAGIGGENYPTGAELYSWGGLTSVLFFGSLAGAFFAKTFWWGRKNPNNILINNFLVIVLVYAFFSGIESRLYSTISGLGYSFLALGFLASGIVRGSLSLIYYIAVFYTFMSFVLWKIVGFEIGKIFAIAGFPFIYYFSYRLICRSGPSIRVSDEQFNSRMVNKPPY